MSKKVSILIFGICAVLLLQAQPDAFYYRIHFTDKNDSPFSLDRPEEFLGDLSIERRIAQGIALDSTDLPVNERYVDSVLSFGVELVHRTKWLNGISVKVLPQDTLNFQSVANLPFVSGIELVRIGGSFKQSDKFELEESLTAPVPNSLSESDYGEGFVQIAMLQTDLLHNMGFKGQGIRIAIMDNGYRGVMLSPFDSMRMNGRLLGYYDFVDGDTNVFNDGNHGTTVLSTMVAYEPGRMIGSAPEAGYYLFNTEDNQSESPLEEDHWLRAAEYADSLGVQVFNTSLGYSTFDEPAFNFDYSDMDGESARISIAAGIASQKGILVVNSAGNEGNSSWNYITAPADAKGIISVGAVHDDEVLAGFSSRGPSYDGRFKPDLCAMGAGVLIANQTGAYVRSSGTSFASPILAGSAASLWSAFPELSSDSLRNLLIQSGDRFYLPDSSYGHGIPNVYNAFIKLSLTDSILNNTQEVKVYPNPVKNSAVAFFGKVPEGSYSILIWNQYGQKIHQESLIVREGNQILYQIPVLVSMAAGKYFLLLRGENIQFLTEFIKL